MSDTHDQQVEKGAKALYESAEALIEHTYTWEELDPPIKEPWLAKARAVLDAVRPQEDALTARECRALRMAVIFGKPPEGHPPLDSAVAKLKRQEAAVPADPEAQP